MLAEREIDEVRSVAHLGRCVSSPDGMVMITHVCKTIPLPVWLIVTSSHELECASHHLVETISGEFVQADRLRPGALVVTTTGIEPVVKSKALDERRPMYDLRVEGPGHRYYTNGISSHNSTGIGGSTLFGLYTQRDYKAMYLAPLQEHCKTFADRLMDMQRGSIVTPSAVIRAGRKCNMYYKESLDGGSLKLLHVLTDPTKVRGNSCAHIKIDECCCGSTAIVVDKDNRKIALQDLSIGDTILAYDERDNTTHYDKITRIVHKGTRHTWRASTANGTITCTSNERFWTPTGWRYLAEFIGPRAGDICPVAGEVLRTVRRREGHDIRHATGGRLVPDQGGPDDPLRSEPRRGADRVLPVKTGHSQGFDRDDDGIRSGKPGLGSDSGTLSDVRIALPRIFTLHVLPSGSRPAGDVSEDCDPGVGGPAELAAGGVVVPGRRGATGDLDGVFDSLVHTDRVREAGSVADGEWSCGPCEADAQAAEHLLGGEGSVGCSRSTYREDPPSHAPDDAVQTANPEDDYLRGVREGVQTAEQCGDMSVGCLSEGAQTRIETRGAQTYDAGAAQREVRQVSGESQGCAGESREAENLPGCQDAGNPERPGTREGLQRQQEALESAEKSVGDRGETESDVHVRLLRQDVPEHGHTQDVAAQPIHPLPEASLQAVGDESKCRPTESQGAREVGTGPELVVDTIVSIEYAGLQDVYDIETERYHTFFADGIAVHNCQNFDPEHLPEIEQVQKAYLKTRTTLFAGTSLHKNTCLDAMYHSCSRGVWHVRCSCPKKHHAMNNIEDIPKMMSPSGLCCPETGKLVNPLIGEFVHESPTLLEMRQASFHIPQVIVPEYAEGDAWLAIWKDFKRYPLNKFLQEVMGIAVDAGVTELTEDDLKACCDDYSMAGLQQDILKGKKHFSYIFSGVDWGGSDWQQAARTKQSYTVHTMYGLEPDGRLRLVNADQYSGMHYQMIAGTIVARHNKYHGFAFGTDNGGGQYYNAYLRDCGHIPTNRLVHFNYSDVKLMLDRIPHPDAVIASLHRTDSISALFADIRNKRIIFPRWEEVRPFAMHFLNVTRNITERPNGNTIFRYLKDPRVADDFLHSTNYAAMMKRITLGEPLIPNAQIVRELQALMGVGTVDLRGVGGGLSPYQTSAPGFISG